MKTVHQYLSIYPIAVNSEKLIVGTIHPHDHLNFALPFFYGNELSIWRILNQAFPGELPGPITLTGIISFLNKRKIAISDTIIVCNRKNPTALDKDLIPLKLNHGLVQQIRDSSITEILFTSGFGKNNAFRLFYTGILGQHLTKQIKEERGTILDASFFGRPVQLTALYSPAGTANTGLVKSKLYLINKHKYMNLQHPVKAFKIDYYKEKFSN